MAILRSNLLLFPSRIYFRIRHVRCEASESAAEADGGKKVPARLSMMQQILRKAEDRAVSAGSEPSPKITLDHVTVSFARSGGPGGYVVAIVAGLWPTLVQSLVLINTAGSIVPSYSSVPLIEEERPSGLAWLQARLLLLYLRTRAGNILKNCYPAKTERVDKMLVNDIVRASYDPGSATVLECIFNFNLSIPLNFLFDSFGGKVLIIQGMRDPITKSELFLSMLRQHCSGVAIKELDAGHCPHDELPAEVNSTLREWVKATDVKPTAEKA